MRRLLPRAAFSPVPFGDGHVHALRAPDPLGASLLHKGLFTWLTADALAALCERPEARLLLLVTEPRRVDAADTCGDESTEVDDDLDDQESVLEAYEVIVHGVADDEDRAQMSSRELSSAAESITRSMRTIGNTLARLPAGVSVRVEIGASTDDTDGEPTETQGDKMFDDGDARQSQLRDHATKMGTCLSGMRKNQLGCMRTSHVSISCCMFLSKGS